MQKKALLVRKNEHFSGNSRQVFGNNLTRIQADEERLSLNGTTPSKTGHDPSLGELNFSELIEKRLGEFVKMIRSSERGNLYDLLIQEVEKPLIKLVLKETSGNQVQASQLLGIHRNTLRKKMKELKIPVLKKSQR